MRCVLQYSPKICPETAEPYHWVGYRSDRKEWLYRYDTTSYTWVRFPKVAISDTPQSLTRATVGETLGAALEQHYATSDPYWFAAHRRYLSARNWLRLLDSAQKQGKVAWPPYDPTVEAS